MSAPDYEFAAGHGAYIAERREHEQRVQYADRFVRALVLLAGGPFVQRQPTGAQCMTGVLDGLAEKSPAWLRSWAGRSVMQRHGLTLEQVEAWRAGGAP
jgi:hypothetical protein